MIWVPTFFICLASGCSFVHLDASLSESICKQTVFQMQKKLDARTDVKAYNGACLEVNKPKDKLT